MHTMKNRGSSLSAHPHPALLQAYADGEAPPARRAALLRHVARCAQCSEQLEQIRALSIEFAGVVASIDGRGAAALERLAQAPPVRPDIVPSRSPRPVARPWLRAASMTAVLLVGSAAAGLSALWLRERLLTEPAELATVTVETPISTSGISVMPRSATIRLELTGLGAGSRVTVRVTETDSVSLDVRSAGATVRFVEREDGIEATLDGSAEVEIGLPRSLPRATVAVDGIVRATKDGSGLDVPPLPEAGVIVQAG